MSNINKKKKKTYGSGSEDNVIKAGRTRFETVWVSTYLTRIRKTSTMQSRTERVGWTSKSHIKSTISLTRVCWSLNRRKKKWMNHKGKHKLNKNEVKMKSKWNRNINYENKCKKYMYKKTTVSQINFITINLQW